MFQYINRETGTLIAAIIAILLCLYLFSENSKLKKNVSAHTKELNEVKYFLSSDNEPDQEESIQQSVESETNQTSPTPVKSNEN